MNASLVRKDYILVRRNILILLGICILVPMLIMIPDGDSTHTQMGPLAFLYMAVLTDLSYMQAVATEEEKNPKATALVCAAPYSRKSYIIAKYICYLLFCAACIAAYSIVALLYPRLSPLSLLEVLILLLIGLILYGIYMPVVIRYGITKARLVFTFGLLFICLLPTVVASMLHPDMALIIAFLQDPPAIIVPILLGVDIAIFLLSMKITIRIFENKEL